MSLPFLPPIPPPPLPSSPPPLTPLCVCVWWVCACVCEIEVRYLSLLLSLCFCFVSFLKHCLSLSPEPRAHRAAGMAGQQASGTYPSGSAPPALGLHCAISWQSPGPQTRYQLGHLLSSLFLLLLDLISLHEQGN